MKRKKHRLRLRKQILACIPIALIITFSITILIINKNKTFKSEIVAETKQQENPSISETRENILNTYFTNLDQNLINLRRDNTIIYYAQKFKLDVNETLRIAHSYTNNYQDTSYLNSFVIGPDSIKNREGSFASEEAGIVYFIRDLYRYPENYGTSINKIRLSESPDVQKNKIDNVIYVDNGKTYEQYLGYICDLYGLNKEIALSISYLETGYLTSGLFNLSNNVGGQRGYDGWLQYPTLEAGIIGHVIGLRSIIRSYNIDLNKENAIVELSSIYVNGHENNPSYSWTEKVTAIKDNISQKDLFK